MANYNKTVLIVDDSEADRMALKSMLGEFKLIEAESGLLRLECAEDLLRDKRHVWMQQLERINQHCL